MLSNVMVGWGRETASLIGDVYSAGEVGARDCIIDW